MAENNETLPDVKNIKTQESYTLPSKGLVYKPEDGIPTAVTLRRMTTKEEKMRLRNESEDKIKKALLQACILENFDVGKLKIEDANFLLFKLRAISLLDDTYKVSLACPECGTEFVHELNLSEVPVNYFDEANLEKLKITLPMCGALIDLKIPSLNDVLSIEDILKERITKFPNLDKGELIFTLSTLLYLDKVNGQDMLSELKEDFIDNLDIIDIRTVKDGIKSLENLFGFATDIPCECPNCKSEVKHGLPITSELFNPSK